MKLNKIISSFKDKKIVVIGDVMLDSYINGKVFRISPEAPIPILNQTDEVYLPGGAANVAKNISSLGGKATLFGFIGRDYAGKILSELLKKEDIDFFASYSDKTTQKMRITSDNHQIVRVDNEEISPKLLRNSALKSLIRKADIVVVSDYAKGTITSELIEEIKSYGKRIMADPKPKNFPYYKNIFLIKLNQLEAFEVSSEKDISSSGRKLANYFGSDIIITKGSEGVSLFGKNGEIIKEFPSSARKISDIVGAGDTFLASLALSISSDSTLEEAVILSNYAAGLSVEKFGTAFITPSELEKRINEK